MRGHQRKDPQDRCRVAELCTGKNVDASLVEDEIGSSDGCAAPPELAIKAHRRRKMFHQQRRAPIDDARMAIVSAHPVRGVGGTARFKTDGVCGSFILWRPVERVVIAAVAEVQETSRRSEKVECRFSIAARALED